MVSGSDEEVFTPTCAHIWNAFPVQGRSQTRRLAGITARRGTHKPVRCGRGTEKVKWEIKEGKEGERKSCSYRWTNKT